MEILMNAQSKSPTKKAGRTARLNTDNWKVNNLSYQEDYPVRGFLQMCADRRFHNLMQKQFKKDAKLTSRQDYWIHADAGGTPKMADRIVAPNYCYGKMKVRLMGWSAHGDNCGGFGDGVKDDEIMLALCKTMQRKVKEYPEAKHFIYFVTVLKKGRRKQTVIYRLIAEPGSEIVCTTG